MSKHSCCESTSTSSSKWGKKIEALCMELNQEGLNRGENWCFRSGEPLSKRQTAYYAQGYQDRGYTKRFWIYSCFALVHYALRRELSIVRGE